METRCYSRTLDACGQWCQRVHLLLAAAGTSDASKMKIPSTGLFTIEVEMTFLSCC